MLRFWMCFSVFIFGILGFTQGDLNFSLRTADRSDLISAQKQMEDFSQKNRFLSLGMLGQSGAVVLQQLGFKPGSFTVTPEISDVVEEGAEGREKTTVLADGVRFHMNCVNRSLILYYDPHLRLTADEIRNLDPKLGNYHVIGIEFLDEDLNVYEAIGTYMLVIQVVDDKNPKLIMRYGELSKGGGVLER